MARLKPRDQGVAPDTDRPPVEGLVPGQRYRRRRGAPARWAGHPGGPTHAEAGPLVTFVEPALAQRPEAGLGGWFVDRQGCSRFYLAEDVVEASRSGARAGVGKSSAPAGETCYAGCGRDRYSQGLCTRDYGRARKLVKDGGASWDDARDVVKAQVEGTKTGGKT